MFDWQIIHSYILCLTYYTYIYVVFDWRILHSFMLCLTDILYIHVCCVWLSYYTFIYVVFDWHILHSCMLCLTLILYIHVCCVWLSYFTFIYVVFDWHIIHSYVLCLKYYTFIYVVFDWQLYIHICCVWHIIYSYMLCLTRYTFIYVVFERHIIHSYHLLSFTSPHCNLKLFYNEEFWAPYEKLLFARFDSSTVTLMKTYAFYECYALSIVKEELACRGACTHDLQRLTIKWIYFSDGHGMWRHGVVSKRLCQVTRHNSRSRLEFSSVCLFVCLIVCSFSLIKILSPEKSKSIFRCNYVSSLPFYLGTFWMKCEPYIKTIPKTCRNKEIKNNE